MTAHRTPAFRLAVVREPVKAGRLTHVWRLTLDGTPIGPAFVDEGSAWFVKQWLAASHRSIEGALMIGRLDLTFLQALGVGWPPKAREIEPPAAEVAPLPQLEFKPWEAVP